MFKKADILLAFLLLLLGFGLLALLQGFSVPGNSVAVTVDGKLQGIYDLSENRVVQIDSANGHNTMEIRDGQVSMTEADCPNGDCMEFGSIRHTNQVIVCLPNKVVLTIRGSDELDSISY